MRSRRLYGTSDSGVVVIVQMHSLESIYFHESEGGCVSSIYLHQRLLYLWLRVAEVINAVILPEKCICILQY